MRALEEVFLGRSLTVAGLPARAGSVDLPAWAWPALLAAIVVMLGIDLARHRDDHEPTVREALVESLIWVACGLAFAAIVAASLGTGAFGEYLSGYLIEKSLSVDNVFVWSMLFIALAIPLRYQHRVLFWGIFGALTLRAGFIFAGTALIKRFWWLLVIFGVFLLATGVKVIRHRRDEDHVTPRGLGLFRRIVPVTDRIDGHAFVTKVHGRRMATPLLAALVVIEISDVIFAVDSVPAVLAVSQDPFIVFSSNAFAVLGLRAMYFLLANARERFHYLRHALGGILVFVGAKMTVSHWLHLNTYLSLAVIGSMLTVAVVASLRRSAQGPQTAPEHQAESAV